MEFELYETNQGGQRMQIAVIGHLSILLIIGSNYVSTVTHANTSGKEIQLGPEWIRVTKEQAAEFSADFLRLAKASGMMSLNDAISAELNS